VGTAGPIIILVLGLVFVAFRKQCAKLAARYALLWGYKINVNLLSYIYIFSGLVFFSCGLLILLGVIRVRSGE